MGELAAENVKVSVPDGVGVLVFVAGVEEVQEGGEVVEFGEGEGGDVELFLGEGGVRGWGVVVVHLDDWVFGICFFFRYMLCMELRRGFFLLFLWVFLRRGLWCESRTRSTRFVWPEYLHGIFSIVIARAGGLREAVTGRCCYSSNEKSGIS